MICSNCKKNIKNDSNFCEYCGNEVKNSTDDTLNNAPLVRSNYKDKFIKLKNSIFKRKFIVVIILIFILMTLTYLNFPKNNKSEQNYNKNEQEMYKTFYINGDECNIENEANYYLKKGFSYLDKFNAEKNFIVPDGFVSQVFYKNGKAVMYAAIHNNTKNICKYDKGSVVKINFYKNIGEVTLHNFIKFGTTYDSIINELGKPEGLFYMNDNEYVWVANSEKKVGTPYYVLGFDNKKTVNSIKIGVWWYDGEYDHVIKEQVN